MENQVSHHACAALRVCLLHIYVGVVQFHLIFHIFSYSGHLSLLVKRTSGKRIMCDRLRCHYQQPTYTTRFNPTFADQVLHKRVILQKLDNSIEPLGNLNPMALRGKAPNGDIHPQSSQGDIELIAQVFIDDLVMSAVT